MIFLSAFGDEIAPALDDQIEVLVAEEIHHLDLRSVDDVSVLDLGMDRAKWIKTRLDEVGITVTAIDSPIGKAPADIDIDEELGRLDRAIEMARLFETPAIRIFSYYPPAEDPGAGKDAYRSLALGNLLALTVKAEEAGDVILLLENDVDLYGDSVDRVTDVLESVGSSRMAAVLDPANFLLAGDLPYPDGYQALKEWLGAVHVKDVANGEVVVAGEGRAQFADMLHAMRDDGYEGVFSLEPHLASAGKLKGFSGRDRFRHASAAFKKLLAELDWAYG